MHQPPFSAAVCSALDRVLGLFNFSSGATDSVLLVGLNTLFEAWWQSEARPWLQIRAALEGRLGELAAESEAFRDPQQARDVMARIWDLVLPGYRTFHRDLLFHLPDTALDAPLFVGRVAQAVIELSGDWPGDGPGLTRVLQRLNDFVGYRPVATLESRKVEPYEHERCRPIPVFIRGVGVGAGPLQGIVQLALEILRQTDPGLLRAAHFDPDNLDELAVDPRAYDFDHPVNKRPNYHFGQWDPHALNSRGMYRRFVIQQVTLDSLSARLVGVTGELAAEYEFEAAAVLAGTMLMASGVSGGGPDAHDSSVTLGTLLPDIAAYRDAFYEQLMTRLADPHLSRLREEAIQLHQPFAQARQSLNAELARRRAAQRERVQLAKIFARMGYAEAAQRQIAVVPVPAARMTCQIECQLTQFNHTLGSGGLSECLALLQGAWQTMLRAIECGAIVDPWNILGFDGNFSLFPAVENSVPDDRIEELVGLIEGMLDRFARLWSAAAARDDLEMCQQVATRFEAFAQWWNQYAAHEVSALRCTSPLSAFYATEHVAEALNQWHKAGAAAGDVGFWAPYVAAFESSKAYGLVIDALLERCDFVASRNLLVHWLSQADRVPLEQGEVSFSRATRRWLRCVLNPGASPLLPLDPNHGSMENWPRVAKFLDFLEANAGEYWRVPQGTPPLASAGGAVPSADEWPFDEAHDEDGSSDDGDADGDDDAEDSGGQLRRKYDSAYEGVVYRDSTDDGVEGPIYDTRDDGTADEFERAATQVADRLEFLDCVSEVARLGALYQHAAGHRGDGSSKAQDRLSVLEGWLDSLRQRRRDLVKLLANVQRWQLPRAGCDPESVLQYDRRRLAKESLQERVITSYIIASSASLLVQAVADQGPAATEPEPDHAAYVEFLRVALHRPQPDLLRKAWNQLENALEQLPILYVPVARGGSPVLLAQIRLRHDLMRNLFAWLSRLGMVQQARQLIETARTMERNAAIGPAAVTEFDSLFESGYRSIIEALVETIHHPPQTLGKRNPSELLVKVLERVTESLLLTWIAHSRTLRLSVLERVVAKDAWQQLVRFIQRYGAEIFTQTFLNLGNVRGILHQGVDQWLSHLEEEDRTDLYPTLFADLGTSLSRERAVSHITLILETVMEGYEEYRDYNSTTTQSDRGDNLYMLLDFLRLKGGYERVVWNMRPVILAHEILVQRGLDDAADQWRQALAERIGEEADRYLVRLKKLQAEYGMRLASIADRLQQRFLHALVVDRICALVAPSMDALDDQRAAEAFARLETYAAELLQHPSGSGWDLPAWLQKLDSEVQRARWGSEDADDQSILKCLYPVPLQSLNQLARQLRRWDRDHRAEDDD